MLPLGLGLEIMLARLEFVRVKLEFYLIRISSYRFRFSFPFFFGKIYGPFNNQDNRVNYSNKTILQIHLRISSIQTLSMTCLTVAFAKPCAAEFVSRLM